jgi:hypothetical protein
MKIYLVHTFIEEYERDMLEEVQYDNHLFSYYYYSFGDKFSTALRWWEDFIERTHIRYPLNVMIDSGAFSAYTRGNPIEFSNYAKFINDYKKKYKDYNIKFTFISLDVIGDHKKSLANYLKFKDLGIDVIPVIHATNFKDKHLKPYLDLKVPYLALGGAVGKGIKMQQLFCKKCWNIFSKEKNYKPKVHLLGMTSPKILSNFPAFSCDSSGWVSYRRWGKGDNIGINSLPRPKIVNNKSIMNGIKKTVVRKEILKYRELERNMTQLWSKRGINYAN